MKFEIIGRLMVLSSFFLLTVLYVFSSASEAQNKKQSVSFSWNRVTLNSASSPISEFERSEKQVITITRFGGVLVGDGLVLKEEEYGSLYNSKDIQLKALVIQASNESEVSLTAFFETVDKLLKSMPSEFKGKVIINLAALKK
jgi:hypothetical protein